MKACWFRRTLCLLTLGTHRLIIFLWFLFYRCNLLLWWKFLGLQGKSLQPLNSLGIVAVVALPADPVKPCHICSAMFISIWYCILPDLWNECFPPNSCLRIWSPQAWHDINFTNGLFVASSIYVFLSLNFLIVFEKLCFSFRWTDEYLTHVH
jgi:hypothetical protein